MRLKAFLLALLFSLSTGTAQAHLPYPSGAGAPAWVPSGAAFAYDFANQRQWSYVPMYYGTGNGSKCQSSYFCYVGPSVNANLIFTQWKDGIVRATGPAAASNIPRFSDYGLWSEGNSGNGISSSNYALNSRDLTTGTGSWTLSSATATKTSIIGADNSSGNATEITATGPNATVLQTLVKPGSLDTSNTSTIVNGGSGYAVNEIITLNDGCATHGKITVKSVSGGVITATVKPVNSTAGSCAAIPANPVAQLSTTGVGVGATFNPFWRQATTSAWLKRKTGTGEVDLTMDNGSTWTAVTSCMGASSFLQCRIPTQTLVNNTVGIRLVTSGDVVDLDFFQTEDDDQASSPIWSGATVTGRGEGYYFGLSGANVNNGAAVNGEWIYGTPMSALYVYSGNFSTTLVHTLEASDYPFQLTGAAGGGAVSLGNTGGTFSGASDTSGLLLNTTGAGTVNKVVVACDGVGCSICVNGSAPTTSSTVKNASTSVGGTHTNVLNNGSNIQPAMGYMTMRAMWTRKVTAGECTALSTVTNNQ